MGARGPKPGSPKTGGRKKGTPNKLSTLARQKAEELGVDPFEVLLYFTAGDWKSLGYDARTEVIGFSATGDEIIDYTIPPELRQRAAKDACEYMFPKLKSIEHSNDSENPISTTIIYETTWRKASPDKENS